MTQLVWDQFGNGQMEPITPTLRYGTMGIQPKSFLGSPSVESSSDPGFGRTWIVHPTAKCMMSTSYARHQRVSYSHRVRKNWRDIYFLVFSQDQATFSCTFLRLFPVDQDWLTTYQMKNMDIVIYHMIPHQFWSNG